MSIDLESTISKIVEKILTDYGSDNVAEQASFKSELRVICLAELNPLVLSLTSGVVAPVPTVSPPGKRGRNGYNVYSSDQRKKLTEDLGEEKAK